ncbi:MAG: hypothetical protein ACO3AY_02905 [Chitinophagaceae bacterium]
MEPLKPKLRWEDYLSITAILVTIGSIFLPWFKVDINTSFSGYQWGVDLGNFTGTYATGGIFALTTSFSAGIMHYFRVRWAFLGGVLNLFLGVGYLTGRLDFHNQLLDSSTNLGKFDYTLEPQYGLLLFIFASIFQIISLVQSQRAYRASLQKKTLF